MANLLSNTTIGGYQSIHTGNIGSYAMPSSGGTVTGQLFISSTNQSFQNLFLKNNSTGSSMPTHLYQRFIARYNNDVNGTDVFHWIRDSWEYNITNNYSDVTIGAYNNGTQYGAHFRVSTDSHVYATNSFRAPIFYDSADTSYYLDLNSTSYLYHLVLSGNSYFRPNSWIQFDGNYGVYWPNHYGLHIYPNNDGSYGSLQVKGSKNGWHGIHFDSNTTLMANANESGFHRQGNGWQFRWTEGTMYVHRGTYGGGTSYTVLDTGNVGNFIPTWGAYSWTSPVFGQYGIKSNLIDNVLYSAADRFEVFKDGVAWNTNAPFNLNYDQSVDVIPTSTSRTYSIVFNTKGNPSYGIVYPWGKIYLSFYYVNIPASVTGRTKDQNGVWSNLSGWTNVANSGSYAVWSADINGSNYLVEMEITITASASVNTWFAQWEYVMGRPGQYELGVFSKAQDNSVWRSLYFRDSSNVARVTINSGGISANTVTSNNFNISNAIYFGGGNNYLNWTSSSIYSNVTIQSGADMRAPIYYDSNDTGYYADFNSTSNSAIRVRGGTLHGPNPTWGKYLYIGTDGRAGTNATVAVTNGNLHIDCENGYALYLNWYSQNNTYTQGNFGIGSDSASYRLHVHGTGYATSDFRAPIFYDSANTNFYGDFASTSVMNGIRFGTSANNATLSGIGDWGVTLTTDNGWIRFGPANSSWAHIYASQSFYFNQDLYVNGNIVITAATIGSQSVSYASTAGSAPNGSNVNNYYDSSVGNGYGFRFWGGSESYKISMGVGGLYQYGPVTDYSIKMQMNDSSSDRGFTWGRISYAPIAALNSTSGDMEVAGYFKSYGYRGNGNVGGTGTASWHPDGIYCGSTMWQYGTMYKNNTGIYSVSEIQFNAGLYLQTYNDRNLIVKGNSSSDAGIEGKNSAGSNVFQIYGNGSDYGFLNGTWASWDIRKTKNGAMYMNNNDSYYLHTNSTSNFYALNIQGSAVVHAGNIGSQSVSYASSAGSVAWTNVSSRPTALSQFSNDLGNYGGWLTTGGKAADSELIDGVDSSRIVFGDGARASTYVSSMDDPNQKSGFFFKDSPTGQPFGDWWNWMTVAGNSWQSSNNYSFQIAHAFHSDDAYIRRMTNGTAYGWRALITSANIGSQSVNYANSAGSATTATTATVASQLNKYGDIYGQDWNGYYVQDKLIAAAVYGHSGANRPVTTYDYGCMISYGEASGPRMQMYFPENQNNINTIFRKPHYRTGWNGNWSTWKTVVEQEGNVCTIVGGNESGFEVHANVGYNQDPLTYFLLRGQADTSWKSLKIRLTGDAGGQNIEFRRIAENGADDRIFYVPRNLNQVIFDYQFVQGSDSRLKDNITPLTNSLDKVKSLRGVEFDWNSGVNEGTHDVGLIAQDVEAVLPEAVGTQEDGYKNLAYTKVIPLLVEAMKEQQVMIDALKAEIELLKNR